MINKLISKSQVRLLEWDGVKSPDYQEGYCDAISDVLDLEPIPTLGVNEIEKLKAEIRNANEMDRFENSNMWQTWFIGLIDKYVYGGES